MDAYSISISKAARKQLDKLPDDVAFNLISAMQSLAVNPRPPGCKKLKGYDAYRIRKGNYRIVYEIHDAVLVIEVVAVGDRKDIYG